MSTSSTADTTTRGGFGRLLLGLTAASAAAYGLGAIFTPHRLWPALLLMCFYLFCLGLGGLLFLAFTSVTSARWSTGIRPVAAALGRMVPLSGAALGAVVCLGLYQYPWAHSGGDHPASFFFKDAWLSPEFFLARTVGYVLLFSLFAVAMTRRGRTTPAGPSKGLSALFIVVFAVVFSTANVDWIMSLTPEWFSTMFGVYQFSGIFLSGLAAIALVAILLSRHGAWQFTLAEDHLRDLAILMFSFSCFWMYIWLSQYMLIWYANLPEETFYFVDRTRGLWGPLFVLNIFLNWAVPFVVLIPRPAKRNPSVVLKVAVVVLVGRWVDLYLMIAPSETVAEPAFAFCEVASILGTAAIFGLLLLPVLRKEEAYRR